MLSLLLTTATSFGYVWTHVDALYASHRSRSLRALSGADAQYLPTSSAAGAADAPSGFAAPASSYLDTIAEACDAGSPDSTPECAAAISDYLGSLSAGTTTEFAKREPVASAITSYLDAVSTGTSEEVDASSSSAGAVTSYLDALSTGTVSVPTPKAMGLYLDAISSGEVADPATEGAIASYLSQLSAGAGAADAAPASSGIPRVGGAASPDSVAPSASVSEISSSYLDIISSACDAAAATEECANAITDHFDEVSIGAEDPTTREPAAAAITSYLDEISTNTPEVVSTSAGAVTSYSDAAAPSPKAIKSYLDDLSATPSAGHKSRSLLPFSDNEEVEVTLESLGRTLRRLLVDHSPETLLGSRLLSSRDLCRTRIGLSLIPNAGRGLFAAQACPKGTLLTCYPGDALIVHTPPTPPRVDGTFRNEDYRLDWRPHVDEALRAENDLSQWPGFLLQVDDWYMIFGHPALDDNAAYAGHFCNDGATMPPRSSSQTSSYVAESSARANARNVLVEGCHMAMVAARDIRQGEEILITYGSGYWTEHDYWTE